MLGRIADLACSHPRRLAAFGFVLFVVVGVLGGPAPGAFNAPNAFNDPGSQSTHAEKSIQHATGEAANATVIALVRARRSSSEVIRVAHVLSADPGVDRVAVPPPAGPLPSVSRDGREVLVAATLHAGASDDDVVGRLQSTLAGDRRVTLGSSGVAGHQVAQQATTDLGIAELFAFPVLALLSLLIFRGIAALLPLAIGGFSVLGAFAVLRAINTALALSPFALNLVIGAGLGLAVPPALPGLDGARRTGGRADGGGFERDPLAGAVRVDGKAPGESEAGAGGQRTLVPPGALGDAPPRRGRRAHLGGDDRAGRACARDPLGRSRCLSAPNELERAHRLGRDRARLPWRGLDSCARRRERARGSRVGAWRLRGRDTPDSRRDRRVGAPLPREPHVGDRRQREGNADHGAVAEPPSSTGSGPCARRAPRPSGAPRPTWSISTPRPPARFRRPRAARRVHFHRLMADDRVRGPARQGPGLTIAATSGVLVLVFQDGNLTGLLGFTKPEGIEQTDFLVLAAIVFGLSTDYSVFLLTRIKEAHDRGLSNPDAVAAGLQRKGAIVTAAAILLAVALGAFMTSKLVFLKELGLGAAFAVLLDAFVVRALLVPALMRLLGDVNWWSPGPLRRLHERLGVGEG